MVVYIAIEPDAYCLTSATANLCNFVLGQWFSKSGPRPTGSRSTARCRVRNALPQASLKHTGAETASKASLGNGWGIKFDIHSSHPSAVRENTKNTVQWPASLPGEQPLLGEWLVCEELFWTTMAEPTSEPSPSRKPSGCLKHLLPQTYALNKDLNSTEVTRYIVSKIIISRPLFRKLSQLSQKPFSTEVFKGKFKWGKLYNFSGAFKQI